MLLIVIIILVCAACSGCHGLKIFGAHRASKLIVHGRIHKANSHCIVHKGISRLYIKNRDTSYLIDTLATNCDDLGSFVAHLKKSSQSKISPLQSQQLYTLVSQRIHQFDGNQLADCIWSLGKMDLQMMPVVDWTQLAVNALERFAAMTNLSTRQVTTFLNGFANLNRRFQHLSSAKQANIFELISFVVNSGKMNAVELSAVMQSLSKMSISWQQLPYSIQAALLSNIELHGMQGKVEDAINAQSATTVVYALGSMKFPIEEAGHLTQQCVYNLACVMLDEAKITDKREKFTCQQVISMIILSCCQ